ncbi:MAG: winged helix-turn-helix transcriptional regulator [Bacteroidales bacterium]|nr:winged helix-turn-helix transcriptional regulator [Bacteroidales bacterium]
MFKIFEQQVINEQCMQKTEAQIIFYLLQDKVNVGKTIREIATVAGVSVGTVHNTLTDLANRGYIVDGGKIRLLRKRQSLIDHWVRGYAETLKPRLFISRFTFLSPAVREQWQSIRLTETLSWGGEPAAALLDGYLRPERWDIYTADNANALIATGRMIPAPQGEIFVYKRFWQSEGTPLLVVYADLLATEDDRCREAAERIKSLL